MGFVSNQTYVAFANALSQGRGNASSLKNKNTGTTNRKESSSLSSLSQRVSEAWENFSFKEKWSEIKKGFFDTFACLDLNKYEAKNNEEQLGEANPSHSQKCASLTKKASEAIKKASSTASKFFNELKNILSYSNDLPMDYATALAVTKAKAEADAAVVQAKAEAEAAEEEKKIRERALEENQKLGVRAIVNGKTVFTPENAVTDADAAAVQAKPEADARAKAEAVAKVEAQVKREQDEITLRVSSGGEEAQSLEGDKLMGELADESMKKVFRDAEKALGQFMANLDAPGVLVN